MYSVGFLKLITVPALCQVKTCSNLNFGLLSKSSLRVLPVGRVCFGILSEKTIEHTAAVKLLNFVDRMQPFGMNFLSEKELFLSFC